MTYVNSFIKSVVKWSENFVRFQFFIGIAFQMGKVLRDFILQCKIWHVCDEMLQSVASDLGLHCLPVTLLGVSRLQ